MKAYDPYFAQLSYQPSPATMSPLLLVCINEINQFFLLPPPEHMDCWLYVHIINMSVVCRTEYNLYPDKLLLKDSMDLQIKNFNIMGVY